MGPKINNLNPIQSENTGWVAAIISLRFALFIGRSRIYKAMTMLLDLLLAYDTFN